MFRDRLMPQIRHHQNRSRKILLEALEIRTLLTGASLAAQPYNGADNGATLVNDLLVPSTGITVTGTSYVGASGQGATYTGFALDDGATQLAISNGVLLTSGLAQDALAGGNPDNDLGGNGDSDLNTLLASATHDANSLTINFNSSPGTHSINFALIFGSAEYPSFVGQSYNDAFAAYLDGVQISFDANNNPITINNNYLSLNNSGGNTVPGVTDAPGTVDVDFRSDLDYGGFTPKLITQAPLAGTTHTLKLVVADDFDGEFDSGVFLADLKGSTAVLGGATTGTPPAPDLGINGDSAPATAYVGDTIPVSWAVINIGDGPTSGSWSDQAYWHRTDASQPDQLVDTVTYSGADLAASDNYTVNENVAAPSTPGTYRLTITTGNGESMTESNPGNNLAGSSFDTVVSTLTANAGGPYTIVNGAALTLAGTGPASGVTYSWDLNNDGAFTDAATLTPTLSAGDLATLGIASVGSYPVTLKATSANGAVATSTAGTLNITAPDLAVTAVTSLAAAYIGDTLSVSWSVTNAGNAATSGTWTDKAYWHRTDVSQADQLLDTVTYNSANLIAGSGTYSVNKNYAVPAAAGTYELLITTGNGEAMTEDTSNNSASASATTVSALTISAGGPYSILLGSGLTLAGTGPASGVIYSWDLNNDNTFTDAAGRAPSLNPGDLIALGLNTSGSYPIKLRATSVNGAVATSSAGALNLGSPDLTLSALAAPSTAYVGDTISVSWTVTNTGDADTSGTWTDKAYWHRTDISQADQLLETITFSGANLTAGGGAYTLNRNYTVSAAPGTYELEIITGNGESMTEDTTNNTASAAPTIVSTLAISAGNAYAINAGANLMLAGTGPASGITYSWDINNDGAYGDATTLTPTLTPADLASLGNFVDGQPHIINLKADDGSGVVVIVSTTFTINAADLDLTSVTAPAAALSGQSIHVDWTVTNAGTADATGSWNDKVYWHQVGGSGPDILVATIAHTGGLVMGDHYSAGADYLVPARAGNYTLVVVSDPDSVIPDLNAANNTAASTPTAVTRALTLTLTGQTRGQGITDIPIPSEDAITLTGTTQFTDDSSPAGPTTVTLRISSGATFTDVDAATDSQGNYTLVLNPAALPAGHYTITARPAGQSPDNIPDAATLSFTRLAPPADNLTSTQNFVWRIYGDVLHRDTEPTGNDYWNNVLTSDNATPLEVATGIVNSDEFRINEIDQFYQSTLGRTADPSGLVTWLNALKAGSTIEQVRAQILASPEYQSLHATNDAFIEGLYQLFLNRDGEVTGLQYWRSKFALGWTRSQVANGFQHSLEYTHFSIQQLYQVYLGRQADPAGEAYWTQQLSQGHSGVETLANILGSQEYDHL